jgi:hypothetical protein
MEVATDLQVAELHWAAAQNATVLRYATGARNEASHRLGARHGIELLLALRNYWWSADPGKTPDDPSAYDPTVRAAATALRGKVLDGFAAEGRIARPEDAARWWSKLAADATFEAGLRLYEPRPWGMAELTAERFNRHVERGEVIVFGDSDRNWALAILLREQQAGEDSSLRLSLLSGAIKPVIELLERARTLCGKTMRFRLPEECALRTSGHEQLLAAGYHASDWTLHLLGRPLDADHPIPDVDPARLILAEPPGPILEPPSW